jgi:hypothetical protein
MFYGIAGLIAAFEIFVGWQALHPDVPANYRAYYLEQTTTCLDQPVSGDYAFGTEISFRSGSEKLVKPLKVCGWEGPVGDGLHAVGESSRLRFALPPSAYRLRLMLEMVAVDKAASAGQPVTVVANGTMLGTVRVLTGVPQRFSFAIPDAALGSGRALDVELRYPQAIRANPQDSDTRKRSIKLSAGSITD